jgi:hypothetical protein
MADIRIDQAGDGARAALESLVRNIIGTDPGFGGSRLTTPEFDLRS